MSESGRRWLSKERSLPCDVIHWASKVPSSRVEIELQLARLADFRASSRRRVSWTAIFLKAYAQVAAELPWLRQSYMPWPMPHIYQHDGSVGWFAVAREHAGRSRLCWGRVVAPEMLPLVEIQQKIDAFQRQPVEQAFTKQLILSRLPWPVRRLCWWAAMNVSGRVRARQVGTFSLSSLAGQGVINRDHPSMLTSSITYGPLDDRGRSLVTMLYDHRLFDGIQAAESLLRLDDVLQQKLVGELKRQATVDRNTGVSVA